MSCRGFRTPTPFVSLLAALKIHEFKDQIFKFWIFFKHSLWDLCQPFCTLRLWLQTLARKPAQKGKQRLHNLICTYDSPMFFIYFMLTDYFKVISILKFQNSSFIYELKLMKALLLYSSNYVFVSSMNFSFNKSFYDKCPFTNSTIFQIRKLLICTV